MTPQVLQERLLTFAVITLKLVDRLPATPAARHLGSQLIRSGTSPGLHYGEVRAAESGKDFVHKLKVVLKELRESFNAIRIIELMEYIAYAEVQPVCKECNELIAIFVSSIKSAEGK